MTPERSPLAAEIYAKQQAGYPVLAIETYEEGRVSKAVAEAFPNRQVYTYSATSELVDGVSGKVVNPQCKWADAFKFAATERPARRSDGSEGRGPVLIMFDYQHVVAGPAGYRPLLQYLEAAKDHRALFVLVAPSWAKLPEELKHAVPVINLPLPSEAELGVRLEAIETAYKANVSDFALASEVRAAQLRAGRGMTLEEFENSLALSALNGWDAGIVEREKMRLVKSPCMSVEQPLSIDALGGLGRLKRYIQDEVLASINDEALRVRGLLLCGIPGCLRGDTPIYDPITGETAGVAERFNRPESFHVLSMDKHGKVITTEAERPFKYPVVPEMLTFSFEGSKITVTPGHRFWTDSGWRTASDVYGEWQQGCAPSLRLTNLDTCLSILRQGEHRSSRIPSDSQSNYAACLGRDGEQLHSAQDSGQYASLPQDDALSHSRAYRRVDALGNGSAHNRAYPESGHHSKPDLDYLASSQIESGYPSLGLPTSSMLDVPYLAMCRDARQSRTGLNLRRTTSPLSAVSLRSKVAAAALTCVLSYIRESQIASLGHPDGEWCTPKDIKPVTGEHYYDFHVPVYENYWACGMWHHNTGKSLSAKVTSSLLGWPLVRFDLSAAKGSLMGQSEAAIRNALALADAVSPCVLWMDEIEKCVGGAASSHQTDGGTVSSMVSTLLTWMQEHSSPVIVVATANDYSKLPAELTRAGRFDERFFLDLPRASERVQIASIHLQRLACANDFALPISEMTDEWTGAEIEQLIKSAARRTKRDLSTDALLAAAAEIIPMSRNANIKELRQWASEHLRIANDEEAAAPAPTGRKLEVSPDPDHAYVAIPPKVGNYAN